VGPPGTVERSSTRTRRVLVGWGILFVLTSTLTVVTAAPLMNSLLERPREDLLLRAVQLSGRMRGRRSESRQVEDLFAAYSRLAGGKPTSREAFREMLDQLVESGLVSREASGFQLTPEGSALLKKEPAAEPVERSKPKDGARPKDRKPQDLGKQRK